MTSENEGNPLPDPETAVTSTELPSSDALKIENEETSTIATPKRPGRKKREISVNDQVMDTQPLFEQPVIVEGKRSRKPTSRLELSDLETPKKEFAIPQVDFFRREIQFGNLVVFARDTVNHWVIFRIVCFDQGRFEGDDFSGF